MSSQGLFLQTMGRSNQTTNCPGEARSPIHPDSYGSSWSERSEMLSRSHCSLFPVLLWAGVPTFAVLYSSLFLIIPLISNIQYLYSLTKVKKNKGEETVAGHLHSGITKKLWLVWLKKKIHLATFQFLK